MDIVRTLFFYPGDSLRLIMFVDVLDTQFVLLGVECRYVVILMSVYIIQAIAGSSRQWQTVRLWQECDPDLLMLMLILYTTYCILVYTTSSALLYGLLSKSFFLNTDKSEIISGHRKLAKISSCHTLMKDRIWGKDWNYVQS